MADQDTPPSRAEQRMAAVAKLKRAASLPRMKDGRRPPMHVEAVSEGEKPQSEEEKPVSEEANIQDEPEQAVEEQEQDVVERKDSDPDVDCPLPPAHKNGDTEGEVDTEQEEASASPNMVFKKRRSRSRSRSRGSKDLKAKFRAAQSPILQLGGDSSQEENPPIPSSPMLPAVPPLLSPIPHFPFLQQNRFLRSPTPASPDMSLFYPGTSPPTPLPTLEDLQKGLMRSNSAGSSAAGRRMAMHKLTGGTESYDSAPSPPPPPFLSKLSRNNTVSGGERIAARQNMLSRLGTRVNKEADAELASGAEDRGATSPTPRRRKRRSRRTSATANTNVVASESDYNSTSPNTPAVSTTPLPTLQNYYAELRAQSTTPNHLFSSRDQSSDRISEDSPPPPLPLSVSGLVEEELKGPEIARRRSVLIEDPDEEDKDSLLEQRYLGLPGTPQHIFQQIDALRTNHSSDGPSNGSQDSTPASGVSVPVFLSQRAASRNENFSSPFSNPLKEKTLSDEDEEQVLYPASTIRPRTPYANQMDNYDREISWIASPVPEIRMPIDDDDDDDEPQQDVEVELGLDEDDEGPLSANSSASFSPENYDDRTHETYDDENSPPASSSSKSVLIEPETSPEHPNFYTPASPSSPTPFSHPPSVDGSVSPPSFPARLSVASRIGDRSPLATDLSDWEEKYTGADSLKREPSASTWEKVKNTFSRAGSSTGRRSRTNSMLTRERRDNTDSSISRESGASLLSAKTDKGELSGPAPQVQAPPLMQSPSASASILSLAPHAPPRSSVSPIPPPSSSDMSKYQNAKLFPFPGMLKLEEERRAKGYVTDVSMHDDAQAMEQSNSSTPAQTPDMNRERKLSDQNPDGHLFQNYGSSKPSSPYYPDYIDVSPSAQQNGNGYNLKLPTTLPGVKQWLSKNSKKKTTSPTGTTNAPISYSPMASTQTQKASIGTKKPSISDVFGRKMNDLGQDSEDNTVSSTISTISTNGDRASGNEPAEPTGNKVFANGTKSPESGPAEKSATPTTDNFVPLSLNIGNGSPFKFPIEPSSTRFTIPTPDPSSISDYPAASLSESSSTTSSRYSLVQGPSLLERLEENLTISSRNSMLSSVTDDPPRKLVLSSPVLQVVNPNTVKDRFLFLFNDILIIAKPVTYDQDSLMDTYKLSLPDRKFTVKSVVHLRNLRFCVDRSETPGKGPASGGRSPLIRSFISQFSKEPDHAIASLFMKSSVPDSGALLGQLLFKTLELDRSRLGEYLARKTSKTVLKSYLDSFGFAGLRIDVALRVFLHSVNISRYAQSYIALDHLLDAFASRWYEANAKFVAYDKDMAIRLVWALAQLNDRLHGGIADEPGATDHISRTVSSKEFVEAFRRYDARYLISDELLQELYRSIYHERLCQACPRTSIGSQETPITIKRPLPTRLTYKSQSEPIIFRLPQADPLLTIELYGQDMVFDPPVLHFSKSSEASFRVMGMSLGPKSVTMCRSGPNAVKYSGLPLSHTIVVERAFMRHTFQIAFLGQTGVKRRYMFSVDDPIKSNAWATSLQRHIDLSTASALAPTGPTSIPGGSKFLKAANAIAFKVLQDTLMSKNNRPSHRANESYSTQNSSPLQLSGSSAQFGGSVRSKSRSRMYHKHGAGKDELELGHRTDNISRESNDSTPESDKANTPELDGALWTARDLEMHCQQNSSISLVLSFLQGGAAERPPS